MNRRNLLRANCRMKINGMREVYVLIAVAEGKVEESSSKSEREDCGKRRSEDAFGQPRGDMIWISIAAMWLPCSLLSPPTDRNDSSGPILRRMSAIAYC